MRSRPAARRSRAKRWRSCRCRRERRFRRGCEMDSQFLSSALANAIGGFAAGVSVAIVCLASRKLCRAIVCSRTARLPRCPDADRAREELAGFVDELHVVERAGLSAQLLLGFAALSREIAARAAERTAITGAAEDQLPARGRKG